MREIWKVFKVMPKLGTLEVVLQRIVSLTHIIIKYMQSALGFGNHNVFCYNLLILVPISSIN